jgi:ribosomal protein S18 acetylase RimI-like enzyme
MESFEKADNKHLVELVGLYNVCKENLLQKKILQWGTWGNNYPGKEYLEASVNAKELFVLKKSDEIVGAVVLNENQAKAWENINWNKNCGKVLVVHALIIDPRHQGKGLGGKLLSFCEDFACKNSYKSIRLDSFRKNEIANKLYLNHGYKNRGVVEFEMKPEGNRTYYCYEKELLCY